MGAVDTQSSTNSIMDVLHSPQNIRNLCIMAHVDHGKTTLADALVASNGIINQRQAGKIRYMDSRKDEIQRGITMKSSCVSLSYNRNDTKYLINLIDSPGHVDFSSEVSTAVRLCDGTIIVVDVVEGVCAQTKVVLKQAWLENICPVLVLNKIDRLILETKMAPIDAYYHIAKVLEQVNAIMGELYNTDVLGRVTNEATHSQREHRTSERERLSSEPPESDVSDLFASWGIEDVDDSNLYFSPNHGNVVFASAYDVWGFSIKHFAELYGAKLGMSREVLNKTLWGDFYISNKGGEKRIMKGARDKRKNPLFVTLILDNIYKLYDSVMIRKDKEEIEKLATCIGVKLPLSVAKSTDTRSKLNYICSRWLPLAPAILDLIVDYLPCANDISEDRAKKLMCSATQNFSSLPKPIQELQVAFTNCDKSDDAPLIVYVSKMVGVKRKNLGSKTRKISKFGVTGKCQPSGPLSEEEIAAKREKIRLNREASRLPRLADSIPLDPNTLTSIKCDESVNKCDSEDEYIFVAFARVFSGTLTPGQKVYVLGPKYDPSMLLANFDNNKILTEEDINKFDHIQTCEITNIYLLVGRELEWLECGPAGSVYGLTGLEDYIIKSATLSSNYICPPFTELTQQATPILRVAVEPQNPRDLLKLRAGLKLLNQADPCVQVILQDSGEYVLVTAGEVHLERCIDDLQQHYACIPIHTSAPIIPFRETIILPPIFDRLNEAIEGENVYTKKGNDDDDDDDDDDSAGVVVCSSKAGVLSVRAVPLPVEATKVLQEYDGLLRSIFNTPLTSSNCKNKEKKIESDYNKDILGLCDVSDNCSRFSNEILDTIQIFKEKLTNAFTEAGPEWENSINEIWSFGPHYCGPNLLLNHIKEYNHPSIWDKLIEINHHPLAQYDTNFITGFQLATAAGPLCDEPMMGVCFIVEDWCLHEEQDGISGQVISLSKDTLRKAYEKQPQRLLCAMYSCVINVTSEVVGKMYSVIGKRHGRIVDGDIIEGSTSWNVTTYLPVVESLDFANELRKSTSGEAMPQLMFSHWEVLDIDPFWEPQTSEELAHWGQKSDSGNIARKYINAVRKRKGLFVDDKIVEFGEKQRTLSKNK